ncbi:cysteine synthase A [Paracoccus saliphilus]|uniref:Cysteine synthase A n=1 Tax=Paracoccus saliphilus TaxID=405559 RepID=A0AA45W853_9RHOB|nr:cysteine synthase A [Paracoccus saliphilus]
MRIQRDFLTAYELPRPARLAANLYAACFPLMKLLPARYILERARADGKLLPCGKVAETTSGTLGLALAMLSATEGFKLTLISATSLIDQSLTDRLRNLGAHLEIIEDPEGSGAQRERLTRLQAILEEQPGTFWPRQYDNPDNRLYVTMPPGIIAMILASHVAANPRLPSPGATFGRNLWKTPRSKSWKRHMSLVFCKASACLSTRHSLHPPS